jgi:hypothetical protein
MQNRHCSGRPLELLGAENKNTKYVKALGKPIGKKQPDAFLIEIIYFQKLLKYLCICTSLYYCGV